MSAFDRAVSWASDGRCTPVADSERGVETLIAAAKNTLLAQQIHRNSQYYFIHRISGFLTDEEVRTSIVGHESLVRALTARDADLAERTARARVLDGLAKVLAHVR